MNPNELCDILLVIIGVCLIFFISTRKQKELFNKLCKIKPIKKIKKNKKKIKKIKSFDKNFSTNSNISKLFLSKNEIKNTVNDQNIILNNTMSNNSNLNESNLYQQNLDNSNLDTLNLDDSNLNEQNLDDSNLDDFDKGKSNLDDSNLDDFNKEKSNLDDSNLGDSNLNKPNLDDSNLESNVDGFLKLDNYENIDSIISESTTANVSNSYNYNNQNLKKLNNYNNVQNDYFLFNNIDTNKESNKKLLSSNIKKTFDITNINEYEKNCDKEIKGNDKEELVYGLLQNETKSFKKINVTNYENEKKCSTLKNAILNLNRTGYLKSDLVEKSWNDTFKPECGNL